MFSNFSKFLNFFKVQNLEKLMNIPGKVNTRRNSHVKTVFRLIVLVIFIVNPVSVFV